AALGEFGRAASRTTRNLWSDALRPRAAAYTRLAFTFVGTGVVVEKLVDLVFLLLLVHARRWIGRCAGADLLLLLLALGIIRTQAERRQRRGCQPAGADPHHAPARCA